MRLALRRDWPCNMENTTNAATSRAIVTVAHLNMSRAMPNCDYAAGVRLLNAGTPREPLFVSYSLPTPLLGTYASWSVYCKPKKTCLLAPLQGVLGMHQ